MTATSGALSRLSFPKNLLAAIYSLFALDTDSGSASIYTFNDLADDDTSMSFVVPTDLPAGTYSLQIGVENTNWSNPVPIYVSATSTPVTPISTTTPVTSPLYPCPSGYNCNSLTLKSINWSSISGNTYGDPRANFGFGDGIPYHDNITATEWCKSVPGKGYISGQSLISDVNPQDQPRFKFNSNGTWSMTQGGDYPRNYVCSAPVTASSTTTASTSIIQQVARPPTVEPAKLTVPTKVATPIATSTSTTTPVFYATSPSPTVVSSSTSTVTVPTKVVATTTSATQTSPTTAAPAVTTTGTAPVIATASLNAAISAGLVTLKVSTTAVNVASVAYYLDGKLAATKTANNLSYQFPAVLFSKASTYYLTAYAVVKTTDGKTIKTNSKVITIMNGLPVNVTWNPADWVANSYVPVSLLFR